MRAPIITAEAVRPATYLAPPCRYREAARRGEPFPVPADVDFDAHRARYLSRLRGTVARLMSRK